MHNKKDNIRESSYKDTILQQAKGAVLIKSSQIKWFFRTVRLKAGRLERRPKAL